MKRLLCIFLCLLVLPCQGARWRVWSNSVASTTFTDNFTRTSENPLSKSGAWTGMTGWAAMQTSSNRATGTTSSTSNGMVVVTPSFPANQKSTITLFATSLVYAGVRFSTGGSGYTVDVDNTTTLTVYKWAAGTPTPIGSSYTVSTLNAGDTVGIGIVGTTITVYVNGVAQGSTITDATYSTGQPMIGCYNLFNDTTQFDATSIP